MAHYNAVRLHSAIAFVTPADKLAGKERANEENATVICLQPAWEVGKRRWGAAEDKL